MTWSRWLGSGGGRILRFAMAATVAAAIGIPGGATAHAAGGSGWLRFGNFADGPGSVDVYVDGVRASSGNAFEQVTPYTSVPAGPHVVDMRTSGSVATSAPIATLTATVAVGTAQTIAAVAGDGGGVATRSFSDDLSAPPPGHGKLRVIPTIASAPNVDVYAAPSANPNQSPTISNQAVGVSLAGPTTPPLFGAAPFGSATQYLAVPAGTYDVEVRATGGGQALLFGQNWPIMAGTIASLVVLNGPSGATLEVLRDAQGSASGAALPVTGPKTGFGGAAPRPGTRTVMWLSLVALAVAASAWTATVLPRRRSGRLSWQGRGR